MCYHGSCVNASTINYNTTNTPSCDPNPCQNNGICVNDLLNIFACNCPSGFSGAYLKK